MRPNGNLFYQNYNIPRIKRQIISEKYGPICYKMNKRFIVEWSKEYFRKDILSERIWNNNIEYYQEDIRGVNRSGLIGVKASV